MITNTQGVEFVLCPKVATEEQVRAACTEVDKHGYQYTRGLVDEADFQNGYPAMLAAAPAFGEPSEEMVERVARAIAIAQGVDPDGMADWKHPSWNAYAEEARAVIRAVLEG